MGVNKYSDYNVAHECTYFTECGTYRHSHSPENNKNNKIFLIFQKYYYVLLFIYPVYLYSVGNISTAMQYMRLMPTLERASNTDDRMRFSIEDVMKYKQAADMPDPRKLTTILIIETKNSKTIYFPL